MAANGSSEPAAGAPIGPGTVLLVVGPSGAGKDALLQRARAALADDGRVHFPERLVSRPAHAAETHAVLPREEFSALRQAGAFALWWEAHGLAYALPRSIDDVVRGGRTAVFNASRAIVADARRRYAHVVVLLVDAPWEVRAGRLVARGRESEREIADRLARSADHVTAGSADIVIDNSGALDDAARKMAEAIRAVAERAFAGAGRDAGARDPGA